MNNKKIESSSKQGCGHWSTKISMNQGKSFELLLLVLQIHVDMVF